MTERTIKIITVLLATVCPIIVGVLTRQELWLWLLAPGGVMIAWGLFVLVRLPRSRIELLLKIVHDRIEPTPADNVRCGFLTPVWFSKRRKAIVKISSYQNNRFDHTRRKIRAGVGTAGRAFSYKKDVVLPFLEGDFREVMLRDWGFTESEVNDLQQDRQSYMSIPFLDDREENVLGIICVDSATALFPTSDRLEKTRFYVPFFCAILQGRKE